MKTYAIAIIESWYDGDKAVMTEFECLTLAEAREKANELNSPEDGRVYLRHNEYAAPRYVIVPQEIKDIMERRELSNYDWDGVECEEQERGASDEACGACDECIAAMREQDLELVQSSIIKTGELDEHYVVDVPHTSPVKWWSCKSFWDTAVNDDDIEYQEFGSMADAAEFYDGMEIPCELTNILTAGNAIAVRRYNDDDWQFFSAAEFDKESYAREVFASDLSSMIVLDSIKDIEYEISHRTGHKADEIRRACREIIERASRS